MHWGILKSQEPEQEMKKSSNLIVAVYPLWCPPKVDRGRLGIEASSQLDDEDDYKWEYHRIQGYHGQFLTVRAPKSQISDLSQSNTKVDPVLRLRRKKMSPSCHYGCEGQDPAGKSRKREKSNVVPGKSLLLLLLVTHEFVNIPTVRQF